MQLFLVILSFILIFAFNSIDNSIACLIGPLSEDFKVSPQRALWLISFCTGGTVVGLILGPALVASWDRRCFLAGCVLLLALSQMALVVCPNFLWALGCRALAGVAAGLIASIMWRLTFHDISKNYYAAMLAVLMSARPLATALGVPAAGLMTYQWNWHWPVTVIALLAASSGLILAWYYPRNPEEVEATPPSPKPQESWLARFLNPYRQALTAPYAWTYYLGSTVNRMAYFGFYSLCGLWFPYHYGLDLAKISLALLIIGLADCLINFATNSIIKRLGHRFTYLSALILSLVILPLFIYGGLNLDWAIAAIALFMTLDRIYSMALVISIPQMFPSIGEKTAFGSLNTLTAWGAMTVISGIQGTFTPLWGMTAMEHLLLTCFIIGSLAITYVQYKTGQFGIRN